MVVEAGLDEMSLVNLWTECTQNKAARCIRLLLLL